MKTITKKENVLIRKSKSLLKECEDLLEQAKQRRLEIENSAANTKLQYEHSKMITISAQ
jgi:hypothetical protein